MDELGQVGQRRLSIAPWQIVGHVRQQHGQVAFGHRNCATPPAVDHGNGGAPVALAGDQPIAHPVLDPESTISFALHHAGDALPCPGRWLAVKGARIDHHSLALKGPARRLRFSVWLDDLDHRQVISLGKLIVALVVSRHGHDGPAAIARQDIVGNIDRHPRAVDGVDCVGSGEHAVTDAICV